MTKKVILKLSDNDFKELYDLEMKFSLWKVDFNNKPNFEEWKIKKFKHKNGVEVTFL